MSEKSKIGFHAGVIAEFSFGESFALQPGVLFSQKGAVSKDNSDDQLALNYIDIPITLKYKIAAGNMKIYIGAGPVISYAIGGKWKSAAGDTDVKFGSSDTDDFKPLDLGLGLGAGLEISSFQIGVNYNLGLSNISPQSGTSFKNNVLGISVAYLFGGKK